MCGLGGSCGQGGPRWVREVLWGRASLWRCWGGARSLGPPGAERAKWGRGLGMAGQRRAGPLHRTEGSRGVCRAERVQTGTALWILAQSVARTGGCGCAALREQEESPLGGARLWRWLVPRHTCALTLARWCCPVLGLCGLGSLQALPARFPPLASVRGAGAEVGGARGRHKCATAASSHSRPHPSRLLAVAVATSRRWGIYRGALRSGGDGAGWVSAGSASSFSHTVGRWLLRECCSPAAGPPTRLTWGRSGICVWK